MIGDACRSRGLRIAAVLYCIAVPLALAGDARATDADSPNSAVSQTFKPAHLRLEEVVSVFREMTGVEDIIADEEARTIVARGPDSMIRRMDDILKTFDTGGPGDPNALTIRVFRLENISSAQAITLLRSRLHVTQCFHARDRARVAVRDTEARLDEAASLLAQADVPSS